MSGTDLVAGPRRVSVPATSANLGPGFDSLGLALDIRDELEGEVTSGGLTVEVDGEGAGSVPLDASHLVVRSMRIAFEAMDVAPPGLRLRCRNRIPHARGLGSSSAAIVGGLGLARALVVDGERRLDDDALFAIAAGIEGHPDNVAPAVFGGLRICGLDTEGFYAVPGTVAPQIGAVVLIPRKGCSTEAARSLLPEQVSHRDAASSAGRAALLVAALAGRPQELLRGTEDRLHQEFRRTAMPATLKLIDDLRSLRVPATVSGAGPTVLAFTASHASVPVAATTLSHCPDGWTSATCGVQARGLRAE